jgi:predicted nucleic acid-binding protein
VIEEAERNIARKIKRAPALALHELIRLAGIRVIKLGDTSLSEAASVNDKDKHVYAAAMSVQADYVITHDRTLIREVNRQGGVLAMTPRDFLQQIVPHLLPPSEPMP